MKRIDAIDGLRGVAAMGVVVFHLRPQIFWLWTMVDLFFVISGFVITRLLLSLPQLDGRTLWNFWLRRGLRIWPLYFFTLLGTLAIGSLLHRQGLIGPPGTGDIWKFFVFVQFTELYDAQFPLRQVAYIRDFLPSWSLAVEEQFYLVWPLLLALLRPRPLIFVLLCVSLVVAAMMVRAHGVIPYVLAARMDGLALGSLAAWLVHTCDSGRFAITLPALRLTLMTCAAAGLTLITPFLLTGLRTGDAEKMFFDYPLAWPLLGFNLIFVALVLFVALDPDNRLHRPLASRPMIYLGSISFAIYMFHGPLMGFYEVGLRALGIHRSPATGLLLVLAIIGAAHLSRDWLELPFNRLKDRFPLQYGAVATPAATDPVR